MQTLQLNIIPFTSSVKEREFSFYNKEGEGFYPIKWKSLFEIMPDWMEKNAQHLYSDFQTPNGALVTTKVDLSKHVHFAQHYFRYFVLEYFKTKADVVFPNFINDIGVWFHDATQDKEQYKVYKKFTIKVQHGRVSNGFELVISYDGTSKVLKTSLKDLVDFPLDKLNWINCNGVLHRFEFMPPEYKQDMGKLFPVLSNKLKPLFGIPADIPVFENRYPKYFKHIKWLYDNYIKTPAFKAATQISVNGFHVVPENKVFQTSNSSNHMQFGRSKIDVNPHFGMKMLGHREVKTTQVYAKVIDVRKREAANTIVLDL